MATSSPPGRSTASTIRGSSDGGGSLTAAQDLLAITTDLPEITIGAGDVLVDEGGRAGSIWLLVEGEMQVLKGDVEVTLISDPGAMIGEMSALLDAPYSASVRAVVDSRLRHVADGRGWLASNPKISALIAVELAQRLRLATTYLADLRQQYGDAPGLSMVSDVLRQLAQPTGQRATPGSARDPNPEY